MNSTRIITNRRLLVQLKQVKRVDTAQKKSRIVTAWAGQVEDSGQSTARIMAQHL